MTDEERAAQEALRDAACLYVWKRFGSGPHATPYIETYEDGYRAGAQEVDVAMKPRGNSDTLRVVIKLASDGKLTLLHQHKFVEVEVLDYRAEAPAGKHRSDRDGTEYRQIVYPAPAEHYVAPNQYTPTGTATSTTTTEESHATDPEA